MSLLKEAADIVEKRREVYGSPLGNFTDIAAGWNHIFRYPITPEQVGLAMIWVKICRESFCPKRDNLLDIAGYADCIEQIKIDIEKLGPKAER